MVQGATFGGGLSPEEIKALYGNHNTSGIGSHKPFLSVTAPKDESIGSMLTRKFDGGQVNGDAFTLRGVGSVPVTGTPWDVKGTQEAGKTSTVPTAEAYIKNGGSVDALSNELAAVTAKHNQMAGIVGANNSDEVYSVTNPNSSFDDGVNFRGRHLNVKQ